MIEHDYDLHGFCHPFVEVGPGFYIRFWPRERKAWVVDSVKDRGRHREADCPDREKWETALSAGAGSGHTAP